MYKTFLGTVLIILMTVSVSTGKTMPIGLDELPAKADFIFEGIVREQSAHWDERGLMIFTEYTIDVTEKIFGKMESPMCLSVSGGTVDGYTITVTNSPKLQIGKKYILFSYENHKYSVPFVGYEQGIFNVVKDKVKNEEYIVDYFGSLIEHTFDGTNLIRGSLVKMSEEGALLKEKIRLKKEAGISLSYQVFDSHGNLVPQSPSLDAPPKVEADSDVVTRSEFIQFIHYRQNSKDTKRCE